MHDMTGHPIEHASVNESALDLLGRRSGELMYEHAGVINELRELSAGGGYHSSDFLEGEGRYVEGDSAPPGDVDPCGGCQVALDVGGDQ